MIEWHWKNFNNLSLNELYDILALREEVFVVEQNCVYQDVDGKDRIGWHLSGWQDGRVVAYLRVLPPGPRFPEFSIGRVVNSPKVRGQGVGRQAMAEGLARIGDQFGNVPVRISAQAYLEKFYGEFGFVRVGDPYQEDGIPHLEMLRSGVTPPAE